MKRRVHRRNIIVGTVIILFLLMAGIWLYLKPSDTIIRLDHYAFTKDHLALYENEFRAEVTSYFYREYRLDPNEEAFWTTEVNGETPAALLQKKAMDSLVYDTVERIEAAKYGVTSPITLKEIKAALEQENTGRQSSAGPSYGPDQYGLTEYISRTQMGVRDSLKEKLLAGTLKPTSEQLKSVYDNADPTLFDNGCSAKVGLFMYYGMKAGEYPKELEAVWACVNRGLAEGKTPADIITEANELTEIRIEYEEVEYDTANIPRDNQEMTWLAEETRYLKPGETSGILDYGASQGILTVLAQTDYGRADFEESQSLLTNLWLEQAYPEYINQCMNNYGYSLNR